MCGRSTRRPARHDDSGFTLIELVVAMMVMLILLTATLGFFVTSLKTVTLAKQRQTATALATQVLEQIRALPYDQVVKGIDSNDIVLTGANRDPHLTSATTFAPTTGGITETLQVTTPSTTPGPARGPLSPHVQAVTPEAGGQSYTVRSYVTQGATAQTSYNLSVLVSWTSNVSNGGKTVIQRSVSYSPSGCLSTATHPFSGPCQAQFGAHAGVTPSAIQVAGVDATTLGGEVELTLPGVTTSLAVEQVSKMHSSVYTSAAKTDTSQSGGVSAAAAADTDPSSSSSFSSSATTAAQTSSTQSRIGSMGELRSTPTTTDTGSAGAMTAASGTTCKRHTGAAITNALPCASGTLTTAGAGGSVSLELNGAAAVSSLSLATMASGAELSAAAWRTVAIDNGLCPTGTGLGCSLAAATRRSPAVTVGTLPSGGNRPAAYTNQFSVSGGGTESLTTEAGVGQAASPATFTRSASTVSYWNGTGYTTAALASLSADTAVSTPALAVAYGSGSSLVEVEVQTDLMLGGTTPAAQAVNADPTCLAAACVVSGSVASTVVAETTYTVTTSIGSTSFVVLTDLGALVTRSSWQQAPSA